MMIVRFYYTNKKYTRFYKNKGPFSMKVLLSWIFDHISSHKMHDFNVHELIKSLKGMPAEIEHVEEVVTNWDDFSIGKVQEIIEKDDISMIVLESAEWRKKITIPARSVDYKTPTEGNERVGCYFLIKRPHKSYKPSFGDAYIWASLTDVGSTKHGLVPELVCSQADFSGAWKKNMPAQDYILSIDNKSITNRPDLWSHRGIAREMCALLGFDIIPEEHLIHSLPIQHYATKTDASAAYSVSIESPICNRFAGLELALNKTSHPDHIPGSLLWMATRLARVDTRARNLMVDLTNYVMFDFGQPMHAFDAEKIHNKTIIVRPAIAGEALSVLDDTKLELTSHDCVVADDRHALSLAGIIGGSKSAVQEHTHKLFLEAAHFDGTAIRLSSAHHKKRTESSVRFEKVLDPYNNTAALMRYVKLLDAADIDYTVTTPIISLGTLAPERVITVEYKFITDRLGIALPPHRVESLLRKLGFGVTIAEGARGSVYTLLVPSWRAGKDITLKEDIIEEVGRCFGYDEIHPILPTRNMVPQDYSAVYLRRVIKQHWAYTLNMREVYNYALYDEQFLHRVGLNIPAPIAIKNPVSENARRLITSLVPHLLKNVEQNCAHEQTLRFFEWGRIWLYDQAQSSDEMKGVIERTVSAGVAYSAHGQIDFYEEKVGIQKLFSMLGLLVEWRPIKDLKTYALWMNPQQTAELVCQEKVIGYAGMVAPDLVRALNPIAGEHGNAFACGLFIDVITSIQPEEPQFTEPSKYQSVDLDISMLVPLSVTVASLEDILARTDARIKDVFLLDVFENPAWKDKRSITMRCHIQDEEKTMTKHEIEEIQAALHAAIQQQGIQVR